MTKASSDYDCADVFFNHFVFHAEIDRFKRTTSFNAFVAVDAGIHVDVVDQGNCLAHWNVGSFARSEVQFKVVGDFHWASFGARATAIAAIGTHVFGFLPKGHDKIADVSFDFFNFCKGLYFDQGLTRRVNHFWCKNSYTTVHRWKGLVQLRHDPSNRWFFFYQGNRDVLFSQVERGVDASHTTANNHGAFGDGHFDHI